MRAVPMARACDDVADGLQAAAASVQMLEEISGGAVDEQDVGLGALRGEVENARVGGDA
jgi:hypothetical protein